MVVGADAAEHGLEGHQVELADEGHRQDVCADVGDAVGDAVLAVWSRIAADGGCRPEQVTSRPWSASQRLSPALSPSAPTSSTLLPGPRRVFADQNVRARAQVETSQPMLSVTTSGLLEGHLLSACTPHPVLSVCVSW